MIHLMLKHITYKNSLSKVITKSFHPNIYLPYVPMYCIFTVTDLESMYSDNLLLLVVTHSTFPFFINT